MNVKKKLTIFLICFFNEVALYVLAWSVTHKGTTRLINGLIDCIMVFKKVLLIYWYVAITRMSCKLEVFARPLTGWDLCRAMHAITRGLGYDGIIRRIKLG